MLATLTRPVASFAGDTLPAGTCGTVQQRPRLPPLPLSPRVRRGAPADYETAGKPGPQHDAAGAGGPGTWCPLAIWARAPPVELKTSPADRRPALPHQSLILTAWSASWPSRSPCCSDPSGPCRPVSGGGATMFRTVPHHAPVSRASAPSPRGLRANNLPGPGLHHDYMPALEREESIVERAPDGSTGPARQARCRPRRGPSTTSPSAPCPAWSRRRRHDHLVCHRTPGGRGPSRLSSVIARPAGQVGVGRAMGSQGRNRRGSHRR